MNCQECGAAMPNVPVSITYNVYMGDAPEVDMPAGHYDLRTFECGQCQSRITTIGDDD